MSEHAIIRFEGVSHNYDDDTVVLKDISFEMERGKFYTLLGPSGCGKTTLLRILAGFEQPDTGTVAIGGEDMRRRPPERRPVNMVFQRYALFPHRTVLENVLFGLESARVKSAEARERAQQALAMCRLQDHGDRRIEQLSGGQAQRVAVARALVNRPRVLLLDEPLAALDLKLRRHMQEELRALQQQLGMTFVYVTHDQDEALALSDLIVLMDGGRIVQTAAPRELYDRPDCVFAATFLGESNVISGTVRDVTGGVARIEADGGVLPGEACDGVTAGALGHLCVRPERVRVAGPESSGLQGEIEDVVFRGATVRCILRLRSGGRLIADQAVLPHVALPQRGDRVAVEWDADAARVLAN